MRILQLCKKFPYPVKDGESIAISYLARALSDLGCEVTLLAMNTSKHRVDTGAVSLETFAHYAAVHAVPVDNHIRPLAALRNLMSDRSYHIERFEHEAFAERLRQLLREEQFDVVQLETLYLAPYVPIIRENSRAIVVLRAHNVEHEIWERIAANSNPVKKWYLNRITPRLKKYEIEQLSAYDLLSGITERDVTHFRRLGLRKAAVVTPIGLDSRDYQPDPSSFQRPLSLSFIGSLDWMPNLEGLRWFLDEVWQPLLAPRFPELTFHIAGRNTPDWLRRLALDRVVVHGEVERAADFINQHSLMVVPLLSGGGMRAKILEGMALGKVALSTRIGMEGIAARHKKEALLADTPAEFAEAIAWCYEQGGALAQIGDKARRLCAEDYDNLAGARRLLEAFHAARAEGVGAAR